MVQILGPSPRAMQAGQIGQQMGMGLAKRLGLAEAENAFQQAGNDPVKLATAMARLTATVPELERSAGQIYEQLLKRAQAQASHQVPFGTQEQGQAIPSQEQGQIAPQQKVSLESFLQPEQKNPFFPSNLGEQQQPGNLPQAATTGIKQPIASNKQLLEWAKPYAEQLSSAGLPTTTPEAYEKLKAINEDYKDANRLVEEERKERVASQREYGNIAEQKFANIMPNAGNEEKAYIKKQVEQLAGENASEADIERLAAGEARKYKNMISKVENSLPAARSYNKPFRKLSGTSKSDEEARNDLRIKIDPLLKAGLYDRARLLLSELGYYPEERELIISNLGENADKTVTQMPKLHAYSSTKYAPSELTESGYTPQDVEKFQNNINQVLTSDPSTNLILLRRKYELEKGVDWRLFKDSLNKSINQGIFKPNGDQFNQLDKLDQPPLDYLDQILYRVGLIGR